MSASFKNHRRAHYDEFLQVREFRQRHLIHESSNDDDEEKLNEGCDAPPSLAVGVEDIDIAHVEDNRHFFRKGEVGDW
ncbi:phosphatase inhibitor 2-like protein [Tanacetum coccineum]|uniref:Phosphatase inhibitor 2-like protein n=1 Tax=Tanacetum coccineum TaxID=301880 RepID=A0ABQ4ZZ78_9ASTR